MRVAVAPKNGSAWLLSLNVESVPCTVALSVNNGLGTDATQHNQRGMSGSPILADDGAAIGVLFTLSESIDTVGIRKPEKSGPQPVLVDDLPGQFVRSSDRQRNR